MGHFLSYTLSANVVLIFLYLAYKLLLAGNKQYRFNRVTLLLMLVLSLGAPFLIPVLEPKQIIPQPVVNPILSNATVDFEMPTGGIIMDTATPLWSRIVLWGYLAGMAVTLAWSLWGYIRLASMVRKGEKRQMGNYTLVITGNKGFGPFSWRKYIVIGDEADIAGAQAIMTHEQRHIKAGHCHDLMFAQFYSVIMWYNPVAWLMIEELKSVHEYEADEAVINSGANIKDYQLLLIKKAVGSRLPSPANSFNHSKLHKRITMMYKSKSSVAARLGALALVPAMAIGMAVVSIPAVASVLSQTSDATLTDKKAAEEVKTDSTGKVNQNSQKSKRVNAESWLAEWKDKLGNDRTMVASRDEKGEMTVTTKSGEEAREAAAAYKEAHGVSEAKGVATAEEQSKTTEKEIYVAVDQQAEYPGGMEALMNFLTQNVKYPKEAIEKNIQGRMIVKFVIEADGKIGDAVILKGIEGDDDKVLEKAAIDIVKRMPAWIPAEVNGKKVASYFNLPVVFKNTSENKEAETK